MDDIVKTPSQFEFDTFRLDCINIKLTNGKTTLSLTPKAFAVLSQLIEAKGNLVTKEALFKTVWAGTIVSESALTVCVREIRKALGDSSKKPKFIETVHKRGYRFIEKIHIVDHSISNKTGKTQTRQPSPPLIDRADELVKLEKILHESQKGFRNIVFISGDAGIGKTRLIEEFRQHYQQNLEDRTMAGHCYENHSPIQPYSVWLEAIASLCQDDPRALALFKQLAPNWLIHTPSLLTTDELEKLKLSLVGINRTEMKQELITFIQHLCSTRLLVIYLEDLQYCDNPSLELLSKIARTETITKLLIIATYRTNNSSANSNASQLKQQLMVRYLCVELNLSSFDRDNITKYLDLLLPSHHLKENFVKTIQFCTEGNPLFIKTLVQDLIRRDHLQKGKNDRWELNCDIDTVVNDLPADLLQLVDQYIAKLQPNDLRVLEIAAVASSVNPDGQFAVFEVASLLDEDPIRIEMQLEKLAMDDHLVNSVEPDNWPDGTFLIQYKFSHNLYERAIYQQIEHESKTAIHRQLGKLLLNGHQGAEDAIAPHLAIHFEKGQDYFKACQFLKINAEVQFQRGLSKQAIKSLRKCLELSLLIDDEAQKTQLQIHTYTCLATILIAEKGNGSAEVEQSYLKALDLIGTDKKNKKLFPVIFGLRSYYLFSNQLKKAHKMSHQLLKISQRLADQELLIEAHVALASTYNFLGDFTNTLKSADAAIKLYNPETSKLHITNYGLDPSVYSHGRAAKALCSLGYLDQAVSRAQSCLMSAQKTSNSYNLSFAYIKCAWIHLFRDEALQAKKWISQALAIANKHEYYLFCIWASVIEGWALVSLGEAEEGIKKISQHLDEPNSLADNVNSYLLTVYAEACYRAHQYKKAESVLNAIVDTSESFFDAKRLLLRGKLVLQDNDNDDQARNVQLAEVYFRKAIETAQSQQAKTYELMAATSLAKLLKDTQRQNQIRELLKPVFSWFDQGLVTSHLIEAQSLLDQLD